MKPDTRAKRRGQQQRRRQRQRTERRGPLPAVPRPYKDPIRWLNQSIRVLPWESRWLRGVLQHDKLYGAVTISRGNGKTTFAGAIAAAAVAPGGPLYVEGTAVVIVAASFVQAREAFEATCEILDPWIKADPDAWRTLDGQRLLVEHKPTGTKCEVRGSEARTLHGLRKARLFVCDEPSQWQPNMADRLWSAIRTSLGKVKGARCLLIGTRPATESHFFAKMLTGKSPATYSVSYHADPDDDPFDPKTWAKANPSLKYLPALRQVIEIEADEAKRDASLLPGFKALRLNMGTRDHEVVMILSAETWAACEALPADPVGGWVLGLDVGANAAMSAAVGYWWRTGLVRSVAMFSDTPTLEQRGRKDHVGDLYEKMHDRGELLTTPGAVVPVELLLGEVVDRWGMPAAIVADRYREAEVRVALKAADWPIIPLILRGQGFRDGTEDVRAFQRACLAGEVAPEVSLLLRSAMAEATGVSDPSGNVKLAKSSEGGRRQLARDDAAAACILAVSQGSKRRKRDQGSTNNVKLRIVA